MVVIDYIFLGLLVVGLIVGLVKGFIKQLFGLASIIVAIIVAGQFSAVVAGWMSSLIPNDNVRYIAAYAICVVLVLIVMGILCRFLSKLFSKLHILKVLDKLLGAVVGVGIVYTIFAVLVPILDMPQDDAIFSAVLGFIKEQLDTSTILPKLYAVNPLGEYLLSLIFPVA